jgi:hypothetical protein
LFIIYIMISSNVNGYNLLYIYLIDLIELKKKNNYFISQIINSY